MDNLANAVIFLVLTLLAIVVAIFVLAASFLGRALEQSRIEKKEAAELEKKLADERDSKLDEVMIEVQKRLKGVEAAEAIEALEKELAQYKRQKKESRKKLKSAVRRYKRYTMLTVPNGVVPTSVLLLISLVLAAITQLFTTSIGYAPLGVAVIILSWACFRIYKSLIVVQEIAVTAEEAQFQREAGTLLAALDMHEEKKRPGFEIEFTDPKQPISLKCSQEGVIKFSISLDHGEIARQAELWISVPNKFELTESDARFSDKYPDRLMTMIELGDMKRGLFYRRRISIKTPAEAGEYTFGYFFNCEGHYGNWKYFPVKVVK